MMRGHAFEMLLTAAIYEQRKKVKLVGSDRSFDLGKCVTVAETSLGVIDDGDRAVLLALKDDWDTATHDVIVMSDDVLWLHLRSAVTTFRKVLGREGEEVAAYREVDTFDRYSLKLSKLEEKLGLTQHQAYALVHHLDLKSDPACYSCKMTSKGSIAWQGLSNRALERARKALDDGLNVDAAVVAYIAKKVKKKR